MNSRFLPFILCALVVSVDLSGQSARLSKEEALRMLQANNPDLAAARAQILRYRGEQTRVSPVLPDNPHMELNYRTGSRTESPLIDTNRNLVLPGEGQRIRGYEGGLSQEFETAGQRGLRMEIAGNGIEGAKIELSRVELKLIGMFRLRYYAHSARGEMVEHLSEHRRFLRNIRSRLGTNFRDPRIGPYALTAFDTDLTALDADIQKQEIAWMENLMNLRRLGVVMSRETATDDYQTFVFPDPTPDERILTLARENNFDLRLSRLELQSAETSVDLADRTVFPNVTAFAFAGHEIYGDASLSPSLSVSERNDYIRLGIRVPIPVVNRNQGEREIARARVEIEKARSEKARLEAESGAVYALEKYSAQIKLIREMSGKLKAAESSLGAISEAFVSRRISYIEFWSEHERWHDIHIRYLETYLSTLDSLTDLELAVGLPYEKFTVNGQNP